MAVSLADIVLFAFSCFIAWSWLTLFFGEPPPVLPKD